MLNKVELRIGKHLDSSHYKTAVLDVTKTGYEILQEALVILKLAQENQTDKKVDYCLLIKSKKKYKLVDLDKPFECANPTPNTLIIVSKASAVVKISTGTNERSINLDLTRPVIKLLPMIAEKLRYRCQAEQYSLYTVNNDDIEKPLKSSIPIALQTSNYKKLLFKRRYYLVFDDEFDDYDDLLHVYRDVKQAYLNKPLVTKEEINDLVELTYQMIYADHETINEAQKYFKEITNQETVPKEILPTNFKQKPNFKKMFEKFFNENPPLDKHDALLQFTKKARLTFTFGCEQYQAQKVTEKDTSIKVNLFIGPRGIKVMDDKKELDTIGILNLQSFSKHHKKFTIQYINDDKVSETLTFNISKIDTFCSYFRENKNLFFNRYSEMRVRRNLRALGINEKQNIELVEGKYKTLKESEDAIEMFIKEMSKMTDFDTTKDEFPIVITSKKENQTNEYTIIKNTLESRQDILNNIFEYKPCDSFKNIIYDACKHRINILEKNITNIREKVFNSNAKDVKFLFKTCIDFIDFITKSYDEMELNDYFNVSKGKLDNLCTQISQSESRSRGITDLIPIIKEDLNESINETKTVIKKLEEIQKNEPERIDKEIISKLNDGTLAILAFFIILDEINNFLFENRIEFFKNELKYEELSFSLLSAIYSTQEFASNLIFENKHNECYFDTIIQFFKYLVSFTKSLSNSLLNNEKPEIIDELKKKIVYLYPIFDLLLIHFGNDKQTLSMKLYPGSIDNMWESINTFQDIEQTIKTLIQSNTFKNDYEFCNYLNESLQQIIKTEDSVISLYKTLQVNPSSQKNRNDTIQIYHITLKKMKELYEKILNYSSIDDETSQQFNNFIEKIENSLYSLTSLHINTIRVDTCIQALESLVKAMSEDKKDQKWIDKLTDTLNSMKSNYDKLCLQPTDGIALQSLQELMLTMYKDIKFIDKNMDIQNHRTIPLIIELIIPYLESTLCNPYISDEYEKCEHIHLYSQAYYNIECLINMYVSLIERPYVNEEICNDINMRLKPIKQIFTDLSLETTKFMENPYSFSISHEIEHNFNQIKISEANLIHSTKELNNIFNNSSLSQCLAMSMKSIKEYFDKVAEMKIRPYRKMLTPENINDYRRYLINFAASLRNIESMPNVSKNDANFIHEESNKILTLIKKIKDASEEPTHHIDDIIYEIENYIQNLYIRGDTINEFKNSNEITVHIDMLQNENEIIIKGEPTTKELFETLLNETINWMKNFNQINPEVYPNDKEFFAVYQNGFTELIEKLTPFVNNHNFDEDIIYNIKDIILSYVNKFPEIPEDISKINKNEKDFNKAKISNSVQRTILSVKDTINYARQFIKIVSIKLNWQKLEISIAEEISELGNVLLEQLEALSDVFEKQLLPHIIVKKSPKLTNIISQLYTFFNNNYKILLKNKDKIELILETFCREINQTLDVIIENVNLLRPVFSDETLIESCKAFKENVIKTIKCYDQHRMTKSKALMFIKEEIPSLLALKETLVSNLENPITQINSEFTDFINSVIKMLENLPNNGSSIKPSQLQQQIDEMYQILSERIPYYQGVLNNLEITWEIVYAQKRLEKYTSCEIRKIFITNSLIIKEQVIGSSEIQLFFENTLENVEELSPSQPISLSMSEYLIGYMDKLNQRSKLPSCIVHAQNVFAPHISQGGVPVIFGSMRTLACSEMNVNNSHKYLQNIMIKMSLMAARLIEKIRETLSDISSETKYYQQLMNTLQQIDVSMLLEYKNVPSLILTYSQLREVSQYLTLLHCTEDEIVELFTRYQEYIYQADCAIANDLLVLYDNLLNKLEISNQNEEFIQKASKILLSNTRCISFKISDVTELAKLFFDFENQFISELEVKAKKDENIKKSLNYIQHINQYKPILMQWINPGNSQAENLLKLGLQSIIENLKQNLETCSLCLNSYSNKIPLYYSLSSSEIEQIDNLIKNAQKNDIDVSKYLSLLENLKELSHEIEIKCNEIFVELASEKAKTSLQHLIPDLANVVEEFSNILGDVESIETTKEEHVEEVVEEVKLPEVIEEVYEEEENVKSIDPNKLVIDIYYALKSRSINKLKELIETLKEQIEINEDLHSLKEWGENATDAIESGQFSLLEKTKSTLTYYLIDQIQWQSKIIDSIQSVLNVNDIFIDQQKALYEISLSYIDSKDKPEELKKISKIAADTQSITVHSFKFFEHVEPKIYYGFYQTIHQIWNSVLLLFSNPSNVVIKRSFRSLSRLLAGLSYSIEDASFQQSNNNISPFELKRIEFLYNVSLLYYDTAFAISTYAAASLPELYDIMMDELNDSFQNDFTNMNNVADMLVQMSTTQNCIDNFNTKLKSVTKAFNDFNLLVRMPENLKFLIDSAQSLHTNLQQLCIVSKQLNDVVIQHPDKENAAKLPNKFTMPPLPTETTDIETSYKQLTEIQSVYKESYTKLKSILFDSSVLNQEIVELTNKLCQNSTNFITSSLKVSFASTDISLQSEIASLLSQLSNDVNKLIRAIKSRLLLKNDWANDAEQAFDGIIFKVQEIIKKSELSVKISKEDEAAADEFKSQFESSIKQNMNIQSQIELFITSIYDKPQTIEREWTNSLSELGLKSCESCIKFLIYQYDHQKDNKTNIPEIIKASESIKDEMNHFLESVKQFSTTSNDENIEDNVIEIAQLLTRSIEIMMNHFYVKNNDTKTHYDTLSAILHGIKSLCNASLEAKRVKIERAEAAKKRAEQIAQRKAGSEKKKREEHNQTMNKEELMKRLNLESRVIRARMLLENQKIKLDKFNASHLLE